MSALQLVFTVTNDLNYDQRMIRICSSLQKAGYSAKLIGRQKKDSAVLAQQPFDQHRLPCFFQQGKFFYLEYNLRLFFHLLTQKTPAAYVAIDIDTIGPVGLVAMLKRRPLIFDAHEYFWETPEVSRRPLIQKIWKTWAKFWVPKATLAYTVAPQLAKLFTSLHTIPFATIRNVPATSNRVEPKRTDQFVILYQGMLNEGRGLEMMVEAMAQIEKAVLWLVGDGDITAKLKASVQELSLQGKVKFFGLKAPSELPAITAQAHLGINLLEDRSLSYYYSLANKCFDYMAAGIPALHMKFPEYEALQEEYGALVLIDNLEPQNIAKTIQELVNDQEQMKKLSLENKRAAQELTWEKEELKLIALYDSILRIG